MNYFCSRFRSLDRPKPHYKLFNSFSLMETEKQRTTPQASMKSKSSLRRNRKKTCDCKLPFTKIEAYCLTRVTWEEVSPIINMIELVYGIDPPPCVKAFIKRIKRKFKKAIYGKTIVKTQQVVMNRNTIEAMTKVTHNKNVNFGG